MVRCAKARAGAGGFCMVRIRSALRTFRHTHTSDGRVIYVCTPHPPEPSASLHLTLVATGSSERGISTTPATCAPQAAHARLLSCCFARGCRRIPPCAGSRDRASAAADTPCCSSGPACNPRTRPRGRRRYLTALAFFKHVSHVEHGDSVPLTQGLVHIPTCTAQVELFGKSYPI